MELVKCPAFSWRDSFGKHADEHLKFLGQVRRCHIIIEQHGEDTLTQCMLVVTGVQWQDESGKGKMGA